MLMCSDRRNQRNGNYGETERESSKIELGRILKSEAAFCPFSVCPNTNPTQGQLYGLLRR